MANGSDCAMRKRKKTKKNSGKKLGRLQKYIDTQ